MLERLFRRSAATVPLTPHQLMVQKWYADGGDYGLRFNYHFDRGAVVLDVGGYEGQWASDLYGRSPCSIHVFEPAKIYAQNIAQRFIHNPEIRVYPFGLGARTRTEQITIAGDATSTIRNQTGRKEEIDIVDVSEWISRSIGDTTSIDLIKINIEGGEFELLPRLLDTGVIKRTKNLQIQFHDVSPTSRAEVDAIRTQLSATHDPVYQYDFVWDDWRRR